MQARGCQPVSAKAFLFSAARRRRAGPAACALLATFLSACAPLPPAVDEAVATQNRAAHEARLGVRVGPKLPPKNAAAAARSAPDTLYELELPEVDQQGVASWYGPGFHGRKTANGERFNQYELTAAHPTYKFGTQLCVRSKSTGQAVVVRVNDRGPFAKTRVIDLSKAAAEEIGMLEAGVKSVEIYKLDEGEEECPEVLMQAQG